ncbi:MAG: hypothetical protein KGJ41_06770 [Rhodospirillales bacterium]|nr:hypothetical protein [Rhodospirillales bacterium]MDE2574027.1 hypothetical protein [Rhodospirillales bacterium]
MDPTPPLPASPDRGAAATRLPGRAKLTIATRLRRGGLVFLTEWAVFLIAGAAVLGAVLIALPVNPRGLAGLVALAAVGASILLGEGSWRADAPMFALGTLLYLVTACLALAPALGTAGAAASRVLLTVALMVPVCFFAGMLATRQAPDQPAPAHRAGDAGGDPPD